MEKLIQDLEGHLLSLNVERLYKDPGHRESKNWLAGLTATLKISRRHSYKDFNNLSQHIYASIPIETRKHAAEQIDVFLRKIIAQYKAEVAIGPTQSSSYKSESPQDPYINESIFKGFQLKKGYFNYQKLVALIEELNFNHQHKKTYSSCILLRAILDHVPPMLGKSSFDQVVNNYNWGGPKSSRLKEVKELQKFRNTPDLALHDPISKKDDVIDFTYLPHKLAINTLLQECLEEEVSPTPAAKSSSAIVDQKDNKQNLIVTFDRKEISWASYAVGRWMWSSFRIVLSINNVHNKSAEYLRASLQSNSNDGLWEARNFLFQNREDENKSRPNEDYRIEAGYKDKVTLFVSVYDIGEHMQKLMPNIDIDTLRLVIETENGEKITLPIKPGWIIKG